MSNILIPIDFSNTSRNAVRYAIALAQPFDIHKITLYHAWEYISVNPDPLMETGEAMTIEVLQETMKENMNNFVAEVKSWNAAIEIQAVNEYANLADGIKNACSDTNNQIIVMGITGGNEKNYSALDDEITTITRHISLPIVLVPSKANFSGIQNIVLACDFKHIGDSFPIKTMTGILQKLKAKLLVLNVSAGTEYNVQTDVHSGTDFIRNQLQEFNPEFHFIESSNIAGGIHQFSEEKNAQLIITTPKKHSWFESLFRKSNTQQLAHHSNIPLLVLHE